MTRVWLLAGAMLVGGVGLWLGSARHVAPLAAPLHVPWWALALLFFLTESAVVRVRYRGQAQAIAFNEIPLVVGLFLSSPPELLVALLVGSTASLVRHRRQSPLQLAVNVSHFFLGGVVALLVFGRMTVGDPLGPPGWTAALVAAVAATVLGHVAITVATVLGGAHPEPGRLRQVLSLGLTSAITATTVALIAVDMIWRDEKSALLLVVPVAMGVLAYRAYLEERSKSDTLEMIYESTRMLQRSPEVDSALAGLLTQARQMFRAERAEITLLPQDGGTDGVRTSLGPGTAVEMMATVAIPPDELQWAGSLPVGRAAFYPDADLGLVAALHERGVREAMAMSVRRDGHVVGVIVVANRVGGFSHFDHTDLDLFESLAHSVSVVLERGTLEQSLQQLRELEAALRHQANHDPLTSLANRATFIERVELALDFGVTDPGRLAVLLIDLDDFKLVNDGRGHAVGDRLLVAVSRRIAGVVGPDDAVARLGGDEFAVLLDSRSRADAERIAAAVLDAVRHPVALDGEAHQVRASVGIAMGDSGRWADELLRNADVAMYTAKSAGKDCFRVFSRDMHVAVLERHDLVADLQRAIENDEFLVHFQPIVEIATGRISHFETLVRWNHPRRGMVPPVEFVPVAEETNLIIPIGRVVLEKACRQVMAWRTGVAGCEHLAVTVNVSGREVEQPGFVAETLELIGAAGASPDAIVLEITESTLMGEGGDTIEKLRRLSSLGIRLAIDDFGTGFSSLSLLTNLPFELLKVAKPFVDDMGRDPQATAFGRAIVNLAHTVHLRVIAEGVERRDQFDELRALRCEYGQGYLFSRPVDAERASRMLAEGVALLDVGPLVAPTRGEAPRSVIPFPA